MQDFIEFDNKKVSFYTLVNKNGISIDITNYGAKIMRLVVPDKNGNFDDVVLGFKLQIGRASCRERV